MFNDLIYVALAFAVFCFGLAGLDLASRALAGIRKAARVKGFKTRTAKAKYEKFCSRDMIPQRFENVNRNF